jgi:hypothetical protein
VGCGGTPGAVCAGYRLDSGRESRVRKGDPLQTIHAHQRDRRRGWRRQARELQAQIAGLGVLVRVLIARVGVQRRVLELIRVMGELAGQVDVVRALPAGRNQRQQHGDDDPVAAAEEYPWHRLLLYNNFPGAGHAAVSQRLPGGG